MTAFQMRRLSPEMGELFSHGGETIPITLRAYGEDKAIRVVSTSGAADPTAVLVIAAIAIPNLLRARITANESAAVDTIGAIKTAQVAYSTLYPEKGFARDLATLGPDPRDASASSARHAGFIDAALGASTCTAGTWCPKSGYRFTVKAVCSERGCKQFVAVATPVSSSTGTRNFCSTSDGVIRFRMGPVLDSPITVSECRAWPPVR
jgi:type IV pilus assembly protein PilA